jgi:hypothetical protein
MASTLNGHLATLTGVQLTSLSPSSKLSHSASLANEMLLLAAPRARRSIQMIAHVQQGHPGLAQAIVRRHPNSTRRPVLVKRSVNSWMAFRSMPISPTLTARANQTGFYFRIFKGLPQKEASVHLTVLWQSDPFKAKWAIIARAYSSIRDAVGKRNAPLDAFLNLVCPVVGIIGADEYLERMKWVSMATDTGSMILIQTSAPDLASLGASICHTSMTEKDVVQYCTRSGYIRGVAAARVQAAFHSQAPQQGLLATAQIPSAPALVQAAAVNGFDVNAEIGTDQPMSSSASSASSATYQWTGSMADLYNPSEGSIDFNSIFGQTSGSLWETINIRDSVSLDNMLGGSGIQNGYFAPSGKSSLLKLSRNLLTAIVPEHDTGYLA